MKLRNLPALCSLRIQTLLHGCLQTDKDLLFHLPEILPFLLRHSANFSIGSVNGLLTIFTADLISVDFLIFLYGRFFQSFKFFLILGTHEAGHSLVVRLGGMLATIATPVILQIVHAPAVVALCVLQFMVDTAQIATAGEVAG